MDVFITSWNRLKFTLETVAAIRTRTCVPIKIHVFDNNSDKDVKDMLFCAHEKGAIDSLTLMNENTGCFYDKLVFQAMVETKEDYYVVTDNDVLPPQLTHLGPCWLTQMVGIMETHKELAMLALQLPPQGLQSPYEIADDIVYCKAIGNTFKLCSRSAIARVAQGMDQVKGLYGDDNLFCLRAHELGYKVAFTRHLWCLHLGQTDNWGYSTEQVKQDPRKQGYGEPFKYEFDLVTYKPLDERWVV